VEETRGYADRGALWSPGHFAVPLAPGAPVTFIASAESADVLAALPPEDAATAERERRRRLLASPAPGVRRALEADTRAAELVFAADQFLITPAGRLHDRVRAQAVGDEVRTVIAGYHWFTDWGRDTMISLEGLTLTTGRWREAGFILRTFAQYVRDGLIPNMFPDGSNEGLYHTADATLWFFHAVDRYARVTGDRGTVRQLLPVLQDIVARHTGGTRFGIGVDPADGLLREGAEGYQLTWMDAKVDGWVVTPRRGKPVEINALWYNALMNLERWTREERGAGAAAVYEDAAGRVRDAFNRRFWHEEGGYLYDVVDGPDGDSAEFRPNQVLAIGLPNAVLDPSRWSPVMAACEARLLTPYGLRSLAPGSPEYKPQYFGNLRARDAAYHQGTVWGWLIGPWVDAWRKLHPGGDARPLLDKLLDHLGEFGMGSIAEIFDAEAPYTPRGCIAQAWSVAELLRCVAASG
jgi:predicted glycogen debranching enzyme